MLDFYFKYPECSGGFAMGRLAMRWTALRRISSTLATIPLRPRSTLVDSPSSASSPPGVREQRGSTRMSSIVSCSAFGRRARALVRERPSATRAGSRRSGFRPCRQAPRDPDGSLLAAYQDHLLRVRGLEPKTCEGHLTYGRRILVWLRDNLPDQSLAKMTGEHVLALVQHFLSLTANNSTDPRQRRMFGHSFASCTGPG